jgi:hypothetical protein
MQKEQTDLKATPLEVQPKMNMSEVKGGLVGTTKVVEKTQEVLSAVELEMLTLVMQQEPSAAFLAWSGVLPAL